MEVTFDKLDKSQISALAYLLRRNNEKQLQSKLSLKDQQLQELLDLRLLIEVPPIDRQIKSRFILSKDETFQSKLKEFLDIKEKPRVRPSRLDIDLLIERLRGVFRDIISEELKKVSSPTVMSFYEFANKCNKYVIRTMSYGNRLSFDKLFAGLDLAKIDEELFKVYIKDLSLIFPDYVRLNPAAPRHHDSRILIEIGGTKYDSIVIKTSLFH